MLEWIFIAMLLAFVMSLFLKSKMSAILAFISSFFPLIAIIDWGHEYGLKIISLGIEKSMEFSLAGITLHFEITPLAWLFMLMIFLLFPAIMIYSYSYYDKNNGFHPFMLLASFSAFGVLLSADFLTFFIFWEIMTLATFTLIYRGKDRKATISYLVFSSFSAILIAIAIAIIYSLNNSLIFSDIALNGRNAVIAILLLITAFSIKSALMPLHVWVPHVYSKSDEPFVAFLAGGLSKLGYYGLFLILFVLKGSETLQNYFDLKTILYPIAVIGAITAFIATIIAFMQDNLRKLLAYSSIAQLGYIAIGIGIATPLAMAGALFQAFNHTFFKASLFLSAGSVYYRTGKWKISELGGIAYKMPLTFMAALFSIFALAAIPITSGFAAKWLLYEAAIDGRYVFLAPVMLIAGVGAFLYSFRVLYGVFLGENRHDDVNEVSLPMVAGMFLPVMPLIIFLIFPGYLLNFIGYGLNQIGIESIAHAKYEIFTSLAKYNSIAVVIALMVAMIPTFIIYKAKKHKIVDFKDNFLAGEPYELHGYVSMHAAHNFYKPIEDIFKPIMKGAEAFFIKVYKAMEEISKAIRHIYTGLSQDYAIYILLFLLVIVGWLIW